MKYIILYIVFCLFFDIFCEDNIVIKKAPAYKNKIRELYEEPIFYLNKNDIVNVIEKGADKYQIILNENKKGWVDKSVLKKAESDIFMKEIEVEGYLKNIDPIYILDFKNEEFRPIRVHKDFLSDPLFEYNIVRENFEWQTELYYNNSKGFLPFLEEDKKNKEKK